MLLLKRPNQMILEWGLRLPGQNIDIATPPGPSLLPQPLPPPGVHERWMSIVAHFVSPLVPLNPRPRLRCLRERQRSAVIWSERRLPPVVGERGGAERRSAFCLFVGLIWEELLSSQQNGKTSATLWLLPPRPPGSHFLSLYLHTHTRFPLAASCL